MQNFELLGYKIKELRRSRHLSQEELADIIGVNFRTIQRIETGKNVPSLETLGKIADAFKIDIKDFFQADCLKRREDVINAINEILQKLDDDRLKTFYKAIYSFYN